MNDGISTFCALATLCALKHVILLMTSRRQRKQRVAVGRVSRIVVYPVKSMKGIDVEQSKCEPSGINAGGLRDRVWMVTTSTYTFVTARQQPKMTTIKPSLHGDWLHLDAPGMDTIKVRSHLDDAADNKHLATVWVETINVVDCGDEVASWISRYLGRQEPSFRLVCHHGNSDMRPCDEGPSRWRSLAKPDDKVVFQDGFPFMLMSESSVDWLNDKLMTSPVTVDHFRPNIVVTDCAAFDEDDWQQLHVGDDVTFYNIKPCTRCIMTTVNPVTGEKRPDEEPLKTLRRYRLLLAEFGDSPCFGVNLVLTHPGVIRAGDPVHAVRQTS